MRSSWRSFLHIYIYVRSDPCCDFPWEQDYPQHRTDDRSFPFCFPFWFWFGFGFTQDFLPFTGVDGGGGEGASIRSNPSESNSSTKSAIVQSLMAAVIRNLSLVSFLIFACNCCKVIAHTPLDSHANDSNFPILVPQLILCMLVLPEVINLTQRL